MENNLVRKFRFREFPVYKDARALNQKIRIISKRFPAEEKYSLTSQLLRAMMSVILNIAEGSDRSTDKDFALFLNRSHASLNEVVACLDIALDSSYIAQSEYLMHIQKIEKLANQITAFRRSLLKDPKK